MSLERQCAFLASFARPWWVAGGWALDLHIAGSNRVHQDLDIAILRRDQLQLQRHLSGWSLCKVVAGTRLPWLPGEQLALPVHQIEARKDDDCLEFLLNEARDDRWVFRRNQEISLPLQLLGRRSHVGIPYLCPQVVLLYKAKQPRLIDSEDFRRTLPTLDQPARRWLAQALKVCHAEHEWLAALESTMQKVLGIGGLFFKSQNPDELAKWYETHLGIAVVPSSYEQEPWRQEAGPTAFAPFKKDTQYFGRPEQSWMVNFRVADLAAMVAQLRAAGITVEDPQSYPNGDFTRLHDPEGNPIELWQFKQPE